MLLRIFGLRSVRIGKPLPDPCCFVANHTSWTDIVMLHSQRAACFVAKAEIARWPLVGWMAACGGTIFHRRGSNHSLSSVMQVMVERLRAAVRWRCFPEGGTGYNGVLKVFHARIFQAALDAEVPVQPVALRFARHGRRGSSMPASASTRASWHNILRLLGEAPLDAEVHFLSPGAGLPGRAPTHGRAIARRIASALGPGHRERRCRMSLLRGADFRPPWPLRSGHIQTMLSSSGVRRITCCRAPRKTVMQVRRAVSWSMAATACASPALYTAQKTQPQSRGLAVLFHGWEGSVDSTYVLQTGSRLLARWLGHLPAEFPRSRRQPRLNEALFHSCRIDEVVHALG
jgi:1-acyl-sn-glycerol-3-phosphate acyltransferase